METHPINFKIMGLIRGIIDDIFLSGGNSDYMTEKDEDKAWQEKMQKKQNEFNERMWNLNNAYNAPDAQMQRLMSAGISRSGAAAMLNGGQSQSPVVASAMPNAPDQNSSSAGINAISSLLGGIKSLALMNSEKENLDADTRNKNADTTRNESTLYYDIQNLIAYNDQIRANIDKMYKDMKYTDEQIEFAKILNKYADGMEQSKLKQINEQIKQTQQAVINMKQDEAKMTWENLFRTEFGIDPHDNIMNQLVQASLNGTMDTVFAGFEKSADEVWKYLEKSIKNDIDNNEDNPTFLGSPITWEDAKNPFMGTIRHITKWGKAKVSDFSNHIGLKNKVQDFKKGFKRGIKNHNSTNNIYGKPWNSY